MNIGMSFTAKKQNSTSKKRMGKVSGRVDLAKLLQQRVELEKQSQKMNITEPICKKKRNREIRHLETSRYE